MTPPVATPSIRGPVKVSAATTAEGASAPEPATISYP